MKKLIYIFVVLSLALSACARVDIDPVRRENTTSVPPSEGDRVKISFSVDVNASLPTRAMAHEPQIQTMRVAVFGSSGYLKEYTQATLESVDEKNYNSDNGNPKYTYSVSLEFSEKPRIVHFIANGPETLSFDSEDVVIANAMVSGTQDAYWQRIYLADGITAKQEWNVETQSFVYVKNDDGSYEMSDKTKNDFNNIPMIRNFAEIVLTSDANNFELVSYALMNEPKSGAIAPYRGEQGFFSTKGTGDKSYESYDYSTIVKDYKGWLPPTAEIDGSVPAQIEFNTEKKYVYERPAVKNNDEKPTWLIMAGKYNGSDVTYYKIFLNDANDVPLALYRNYTYTINVHEVTKAGYTTPEAAANGAGSGDVSASVSADVASVSDGSATLSVQPATNWTFADGEKEYSTIKFAFYGNGAGNGQVTIQTISIGSEGQEVISGSSVGTRNGITISESDDEDGFRTITFTTTKTSNATKTQVIRIIGTKTSGSTLYRDVTLNLIAKQNLRISLNPEAEVPGEVEYGTGKAVVVRLELPDNLPKSIFPLAMNLEPYPHALNPDPSSSDRIPVESGATLVSGSTKNSFHFVKTITWEEYVNATKTDDNYHIIDSDFITVTDLVPGAESCKVYVSNEYFVDNSATLGVYNWRDFSNASIIASAEANDDGLYPVTFKFSMDQAEYNGVEVYLKMKGVFINNATESVLEQVGSVSADGEYTYKFTATNVANSFNLLTSNPEAVMSIEMSAKHYRTKTVDNQVDYTVELDPSSLSMSISGGTKTISATVTADGAAASSDVLTWTSSDNSVATVVNGVVTPVGLGTATIKATAPDGTYATCEVTVRNRTWKTGSYTIDLTTQANYNQNSFTSGVQNVVFSNAKGDYSGGNNRRYYKLMGVESMGWTYAGSYVVTAPSSLTDSKITRVEMSYYRSNNGTYNQQTVTVTGDVSNSTTLTGNKTSWSSTSLGEGEGDNSVTVTMAYPRREDPNRLTSLTVYYGYWSEE